MPTSVTVPDMGRNEAALVAGWYVPSGTRVRRGDHLCRIEIDDIVIDVPAEADGELRQGVPEGRIVPPGAVVGLIVSPEESSDARNNGQGGPLRVRTRATASKRSTAFDMAAVPDFAGDDIFSPPEPAPVLGRRILPRALDAAAAGAPVRERESEPEPVPDEPDARHPEAQAPGLRRLNFGRRAPRGGAKAASAVSDPSPEAGPVEEPAPRAEPEPQPEPEMQAEPALRAEPEPQPEPALRAEPADHGAEEVIGLAEAVLIDEEAGSEPEALTESEPEPRGEPEPELAPTAAADPAPGEEPEPSEQAHPAPAVVPPPPVAAPARGDSASEHAEERPGPARASRASTPAPASRVPVVDAQVMTAIIHLGKAVELCEELAREWEHHLAPSPDDLAVRAIARAAARLGICKAPRHSLRVVSLSGHGADEQVLGDVSDRPFRDLVGARRGSERAPFDPCLSVTILNGVRLASAVPMLGGGSLAFAIGAMRDMARVNGETVSVEPAITLTLAYDPEHVGMPQAAQLVCKIKELVERPYALLTD